MLKAGGKQEPLVSLAKSTQPPSRLAFDEHFVYFNAGKAIQKWPKPP
jgi:hypothetical protein